MRFSRNIKNVKQEGEKLSITNDQEENNRLIYFKQIGEARGQELTDLTVSISCTCIFSCFLNHLFGQWHHLDISLRETGIQVMYLVVNLSLKIRSVLFANIVLKIKCMMV